MGIIGAIIVVLMVSGIVLLSPYSPLKKRTRENYFEELEEILAVKAEPVKGMENSFQLRFHFEGLDFLYEDLEQDSFLEKMNKAFLKIQTSGDFTLNFTEKEGGAVTRSDLRLISEVSISDIDDTQYVHLPKELEEFKVTTNNTFIANKLLEDKNIIRIFLDFKNVDYRGYPFLSLKIFNGLIILEFHPLGYINPSIESLHLNVSSIETYINRLAYLHNKLEEIIEDMK